MKIYMQNICPISHLTINTKKSLNTGLINFVPILLEFLTIWKLAGMVKWSKWHGPIYNVATRWLSWSKAQPSGALHQKVNKELKNKNKNLPLWFFKNAIVDFRTVDLSIFRLFVDTIDDNSFINILNWSLLFFSLRFLDFL